MMRRGGVTVKGRLADAPEQKLYDLAFHSLRPREFVSLSLVASGKSAEAGARVVTEGCRCGGSRSVKGGKTPDLPVAGGGDGRIIGYPKLKPHDLRHGVVIEVLEQRQDPE